MEVKIDWLEGNKNAVPAERETVCDLKIYISDQNSCVFLDEISKNVSDHLTISVYPLVEGLVENWWNIMGGRDVQYRLIQNRSGYVTPDIRLKYDGEVFEIWSEQCSYPQSKIKFWEIPTEVLSRDRAEDELSKFIETVISRVGEQNSDLGSLKRGWDRILESRKVSDESKFCEAAGSLGLDPYNISDGEAQVIEKSGNLFSGEALSEFLAGVKNLKNKHEPLEWVKSVQSRPRYYSRLSGLQPLAAEIARNDTKQATERSWALGYRRARKARDLLGLEPSDATGSTTSLIRRLGGNSFRRAPKFVGIRALVVDDQTNKYIHLSERGANPTAKSIDKFAFARAIGDSICFPETERSVVNNLHDASRQAAGRAFAAEFLAPIDRISDMLDGGYDIYAIATELDVNTEVIERQIENKNRITTA